MKKNKVPGQTWCESLKISTPFFHQKSYQSTRISSVDVHFAFQPFLFPGVFCWGMEAPRGNEISGSNAQDVQQNDPNCQISQIPKKESNYIVLFPSTFHRVNSVLVFGTIFHLPPSFFI